MTKIQSMPKIFIDNTSYEVKNGKNVLEACLTLGFDLPYFCWHPAMGSVGACRQCAVKLFKDENDNTGKIVMSCMEGVREGMRLSINDHAAKAFREQVIEWLMTNHPHDCPVCDEGGSCHLQDMTVMTGHDYRRYQYKKRTYKNQFLGPFIHHEMNRCIQCYRCVRFYKDYAGGDDLNVFAAHNHVYFGREKDGTLESPFSGNLAEVCPTGVFTDKTLREHYTRKWDLTSAASVCQHCSVGCNTIAGERYGALRSIVNRYNGEVNGYFLCDRGRFGYQFVNSENRVTKPQVNQHAVDDAALMNHLETLITNHTLIGIGSPRASMESNFTLAQLTGKDNFFCGITSDDLMLQKRIVDILSSGNIPAATLRDIDNADGIVVLGEDVWNTAPVMALAIRQAVMKSGSARVMEKTPMPEWHDIAIKELQQEEKGFMANVTVAATSLDNIASVNINAAPDDIARFGFAVAHSVQSTLVELTGFDETLVKKADQVAQALQKCKRPVVISGTSCYNDHILRAAYDIATSLKQAGKDAMIAYVLPECNSMGLAMMQAAPFDGVVRKVNRENNITAIIVEEDLYRNLPEIIVDDFLSKCKNVIVLDSLNNKTTQKANALIPVSTFAEADGTLINYEGRAQRFCQVFMPDNKFISESWKWLSRMKLLQAGKANGLDFHHDDVLDALETSMQQFSGIASAAPRASFRINGEQIPREPHRYSGRTAMLANRSVSEPKPLQDEDSPLSFTMEGYQGIPPSSVIPFFWTPGWNSPQAVNKYQQEVGGDLLGGNPGVRLLNKPSGKVSGFKDYPEPFKERLNKWLLLPQSHIFGSDELSVYTKGIADRAPEPYIGLSPVDAKMINAVEGAQVTVKIDKHAYSYPVKVIESLRNGVALVPKGLPGMPGMNWGEWVEIARR
jgi:NADH-quinone oxidoreductase subunit G